MGDVTLHGADLHSKHGFAGLRAEVQSASGSPNEVDDDEVTWVCNQLIANRLVAAIHAAAIRIDCCFDEFFPPRVLFVDDLTENWERLDAVSAVVTDSDIAEAWVAVRGGARNPAPLTSPRAVCATTAGLHALVGRHVTIDTGDDWPVRGTLLARFDDHLVVGDANESALVIVAWHAVRTVSCSQLSSEEWTRIEPG